MFISDQRILELYEHLKATGKIRFDTDFCDIIEIRKQNFYNIKNQLDKSRGCHFTPNHIRNVCQKLGVNANWIFGQSSKMYLSHKTGAVTLPVTLTTKKSIEIT